MRACSRGGGSYCHQPNFEEIGLVDKRPIFFLLRAFLGINVRLMREIKTVNQRARIFHTPSICSQETSEELSWNLIVECHFVFSTSIVQWFKESAYKHIFGDTVIFLFLSESSNIMFFLEIYLHFHSFSWLIFLFMQKDMPHWIKNRCGRIVLIQNFLYDYVLSEVAKLKRTKKFLPFKIVRSASSKSVSASLLRLYTVQRDWDRKYKHIDVNI